MKIPAIKKLVETYTTDQLQTAEAAILDEQKPEIEIDGADEGEQLTHVLAAVFIHHQIDTHGMDFTTALRTYTQKVRVSIS